MNKVWTLTLLLLAYSASAIEFFEGSFDEAKELAQKEGKIIFVDAYTSWCGPCKLMSAKVFPTPEVSEVFDASFINIKIDMEKGEGPAFAKKYGVRAYPTLLFLSSTGEVIHIKVGGLKPEDLANLGRTVLSKANKAEEYTKKYEENPDQSAAFMISYLQELNKANASTSKITNDYLRTNPSLSKDSVLLISFEGMEDAGSSLYSLALANTDKLIQIYGESTVQGKFQKTADKSLQLASSFHSDQFVLPLEEMDKVFNYDVGKMTIADFYLSENNATKVKEYLGQLNSPEAKIIWTEKIMTNSSLSTEEKASLLSVTGDQFMKESTDLEKLGEVLTILHDAGEKKAVKNFKSIILDRSKEEDFGIRQDQLKAYLNTF